MKEKILQKQDLRFDTSWQKRIKTRWTNNIQTIGKLKPQQLIESTKPSDV